MSQASRPLDSLGLTILADEPIGNLDATSAQGVLQSLSRLNKESLWADRSGTSWLGSLTVFRTQYSAQ